MRAELTARISELKPYVPCEFARKPRDFTDMQYWKAVEYRFFTLYSGIVVFKNILSEELYYHFLILHCCYRGLLSKQTYYSNLDMIQNMFEYFVESFSDLYGKKNLTYNVHNVLHIVQSIRDVGFIQDFSAYKYENFMQHIKKGIKRPSKILEQLNKRFCNQSLSEEKEDHGFITKNSVIVKFRTEQFTLSLNRPNNACCIKPCIPILVTNFLNDGYVVGKRFLNTRVFYTAPVNSDTFGIFQADQGWSEEEEKFSVSLISHKYIYLPHDNTFILLPLLHNM